MAIKITEPINNNPGTQDWQDLLIKLTTTTGGLYLIDYSEKRTTNIPKILIGSRFELNSSFYQVSGNDEAILGWSSVPSGQFVYVYARINSNNDAEFYWSNIKSEFQVAKGGYFHPTNNERCILSAYKQSETRCHVKSLVGQIRKFDLPTDTTGTEIANNQNLNRQIEAGWYRVVIQGGRGGNGGNGGASGTFYGISIFTSSTNAGVNDIVSSIIGKDGESGKVGIVKTFYLWLEAGTIELKVGKTGNDGIAGTAGDNGVNNSTTPPHGCGGGGDGGDGVEGETSILLNNGNIVAVAEGGKNGKGGKGTKGAYALTHVLEQGAYYPRWRTPPNQGNNGGNGNGYSNATTGSIQVFAL